MIFHKLSLIVIIFFTILSIYFTVRKKNEALLLLFILGLGLSGFSVYLGTLWFPYKIVSIFILIKVFTFKNSLKSSKYFRYLLILFAVSLFIGLLNRPPTEPANLPILQSSLMRPFVQLFTYVSIAVLIPFIIFTFKEEEDLNNFFKKYNMIVEIIMSFAILQFILLKLGIDFMPILRPNIKDSPTAAFNYGGIIITRLYGITGEPKTLAAFLFPYFFISLYNFYKKHYNKNFWYHITMLVLNLFVIINTFSSAIFISFVICIFLIIFIWFKDIKTFLIIPIILIFFVQFFNPATFSLTTDRYSSISFYDLITNRTITRLEIQGEERPEYLAIRYIFLEKPYLSLLGMGMGIYPYIITSGGWYGIDPIDSNWVVFLMDFGLVGIFLLMIIMFKALHLRSNSFYQKNILLNTSLIGLLSSYILGLGIGSYVYMILFLALTITTYKIIRNKKIVINIKPPLNNLNK